MALQVWLPLTKDLRNQGLDNITVTTTNTNVFQNEGKIGGKSIDVSGHYAFKVPSLVKKRVFSCSFWYKPITDNSLSDNWRRIVVFDTYTSDGSTTGAIFRFESSYGYQSSSTTYCISIHNNSGEPIASIGTGLGATDGWNKWQHITITADGTTLKCYRDGVQIASGAMGNGGMLQGTVHIGYSGNRPIGRLNDFRLYDHCLSPMEVKQLSQGLVLHYPLNRLGWGQENLFIDTALESVDTSIANSSTDWTKYFRRYNGSAAIHNISNGEDTITLNSASNLGICFVRKATDINLDSSSYYTISCEAKSTQTTKQMCIGLSYYNNSNTWIWRGGSNGQSFTTTNKWQKFTLTFKPDADTQYICYCFTVVGVANGTDTWTIRNCKLEKGSIATPWCPNSSDALATTMGLNSNVEYDCSGYCNNGEKIGTLTYTSDTPKYAVSTHIDATTTKIHISNLSTSGFGNSYSFAWWAKVSSITPMHWGFSDGIRLNGMYTGCLWNTGDGSNNPLYNIGTTTQVTAPTKNVWHHWVMTGDGTKCYVYQDGELWAEAKTYKAISGTSIYINGWNSATDYSSNNYSISDFRIYATALSADDVKSLYQNSAYIDSSGNVYGAVHSEV